MKIGLIFKKNHANFIAPSNMRNQWLILVSGLIVLACTLAYLGLSNRRDITNQEHYRLRTQARVIALNLDQQLVNANHALESVMRDMTYLRQHDDIQLSIRRLQTLSNAMPGIRTLMILDKSGGVLASNRDELLGRNFSTRDYFATPAKGNDPAILYVSPPFKSVLGSFLFNITRVIHAPDGSFDGLITASIDPAYFQRLLSSVLYAPDMLSSITHGDGLRFMLVPDQTSTQEVNLAQPDSFFTRHRESGRDESILTGISPGYTAARDIAFWTVRSKQLRMDKSLYVACSRDHAAIYADWNSNAIKQLLAFVLISIAACLGLSMLQRRQRHLERIAAQGRELIDLRVSLLEQIASQNIENILQQALDRICTLSGSACAFYQSMSPDRHSPSRYMTSTQAPDVAYVADNGWLHVPVEKSAEWADCVRDRRALVHNDYARPADHDPWASGATPLQRDVLIPIFQANDLVAVLGVCNKLDDYSDQDIEWITSLAGMVWEIAERKRHEDERNKLGLRLQTLQSVARDGIHVIDLAGNLVESNPAFRQMLGYDIQDTPVLNVSDWDVGFTQDGLNAKISDLLHAPSVFETRHRRRDGTEFEVEISACALQLEGRWYLYASSRDISSRKAIEASLQESRQLQSDIFDFLPDATFVVDQDKKVIAWNRAMEEMSGVDKKDVIGQGDHVYTIPFYGDRRPHLIDLVDIDDEELKTHYQHVKRQGEHLFAEAFCPALNNGKGAFVWAVVAPLYGNNGERIGTIESIRDITAIKAAEEDLARSNQELEQFAYVASHDLQEPLRKIAGFTELLANRYKGTFDEKGVSYMAYIIDGATRMRSLINDLLSYSRVMHSSKTATETDSAAVVQKVLQDMELLIKDSQAEILVHALSVVLADKMPLVQLFQNLIGNAIKFRSLTSPPRIEIRAIQQGSKWLFSVADNGIGIAPEFSERIFTIFQRLHTREEYPGTGIGLAVCKKIVEQFGGKIWVESIEGTGSTFYFTLPALHH